MKHRYHIRLVVELEPAKLPQLMGAIDRIVLAAAEMPADPEITHIGPLSPERQKNDEEARLA